MTFFGSPLSDYVAFAKMFLILVLLTGILRLFFDSPWLSMTAVMWIGGIYYAVHTSRLGAQKVAPRS